MNRTRTAITIILSAMILIPGISQTGRDHPERWYQTFWCQDQRGKMKYRLPDKTRCDCLTRTHAVEFDLDNKWPEAVGAGAY